MIERRSSQQGARFLFIAAALVIIIMGVNLARTAMESSLAAVFLAMLGTPPVLWLERKRVPSIVAVLLVVAGMVAILLVLLAIAATAINDFYTELPAYHTRILGHVSELRSFFASKGILGMDEVLQKIVDPGKLMSLTPDLFARLGSAFKIFLLVMLTVAFILFEASSFPIKLRAVLGHPHQVFPEFTKFFVDIERYVVIKTIISLITGILIWLWLSIVGVDFPILWGFLAFLLNYVPSVGSSIAAVPAVILALVQLGIGAALAATAGYMAINFLLDNVIETRLMGQKLGLSTLVVFLSLVFWGSLLGPIGAVLCIPLTMTLKFACENNESARWIAVLLGPEVPSDGNPPVSGEGTDPDHLK